MKRYALFVCALLAGTAAVAQELKPFVHGSRAAIVAAHQGQPFILALWSLDCSYCIDDLALLGRLKARYRKLNVVLVATDDPVRNADVTATLQRHHLPVAEAWVFADGYTERLRFEVDPQWHGELPRTYFFAADGRTEVVSGRIEAARLERWIAANLRHD